MLNEFGQLVGDPLPNWKSPPAPPRNVMEGRYCRLEPLSVETHAADLYEGIRAEPDARSWTYLGYGPFPTFESYRSWMTATCVNNDPLFFAIIYNKTAKAGGVASY